MSNKVINKKAVLYCRVSTSNQMKEGLSIDTQVTICQEAAKKDGCGDNPLVIRDEGKSAGSLNRKGIQEIIKLIMSQSIGFLYMVSSDRLARNTADDIMVRDLCRKHNVVLKCLNQPNSEDNAMSRMVNTVFASFNQLQRDITSEKVKQTMTVKAEAGYFPSMAALGYRNVRNPNSGVERVAQKIIAPDPESAPFITSMFRLYATGNFNVHDLTDVLYEKGLRTKKGGKVMPSRMFGMLKDRSYLGEIHWGEVHLKEGKHPPLIDEDTFNLVQSILTSNNHHACRRRKHNFLLNGFLYCARHGRRYTAEWHLNKNVAYYHCTNPKGCGKYIRQTVIEQEIADKFKELEFAPELIDKVIEKVKSIFFERREKYNTKKQGLVNQRIAIEAKQKAVEDRLLEGVMSNDDYIRRRDEFREQLSSVDRRTFELEQEQKVKMDVAHEILFLMKDVYQAYNNASHNLKRHLLGFFWEKFEVMDGVIIKCHPGPLFVALLEFEQAYYNIASSRKTLETKGISDSIISDSLCAR